MIARIRALLTLWRHADTRWLIQEAATYKASSVGARSAARDPQKMALLRENLARLNRDGRN